MMTDEELKRYSRQIPVIGIDGQESLKRTRILLAGAGGLGSAIAIYLTVAGVGLIRVVDHDVVEESNLNRQILHWSYDIGRQKTASMEEKLAKINPHVKVEKISATIDETNINEIVSDVDLIVDAMDNYAARYLLNIAALRRDVPFFHGAVQGFYGQITTIFPGRTACLRCIFPEGPFAAPIPVVGATCGVIGAMQATEVIKYITGNDDLLAGRLLLWDGLAGDVSVLEVAKNPDCVDCGKRKGIS